MNKTCKKLVSVVLTGMLIAGAAPVGAYAASPAAPADTGQSKAISQTVTAASEKGDAAPPVGEVAFKRAYFRQSSFIDNIYLAKASAQLAMASANYYDPGDDPQQTDPSLNADKLLNTLESIGFRDVKANSYYSVPDLPDSIGAALGHMTVTQDGKEYTLIAVVPRSEAYKQEWVGNFEIGGGDLHEGFKAARDEILRFTKQYIQENQITGDVKIWMGGHSRGASVANLLGGFLAGGGAAYLGDEVRISPQDIYCYCFATSPCIRAGAANAEVLSVAGKRDGRYGKYDTDGPAFAYSGEGVVDPEADIYGGIKKYVNPEDIVSKLPPAQWGLTSYGTEEPVAGDATWEEMLAQIKVVQANLYDLYANADPAKFTWYRFDLASLRLPELSPNSDPADLTFDPSDLSSLGLVPDPKKSGGMKEFLDDRIAVLTEMTPTNEDYVTSGFQELTEAFGGINGLLLYGNQDYIFGDQGTAAMALAKPLVLTYLAYASERIRAEYAEEGVELSEAEAMGVFLGEFCSYISGLEVPEEPTADFIVLAYAEFVAQNPDSAVVHSILGPISGSLDRMPDVVKTALLSFTPYGRWKKASNEEILRNILIACARGPVKGTTAALAFKDAAAVRNQLYDQMSNVLADYPELDAAIDHGQGSLTDLSAVLLKMLLEDKTGSADANDGEAGGTEQEGEPGGVGQEGQQGEGGGEDPGEETVEVSLADAADSSLKEALTPILYNAAAKGDELYKAKNPEYYEDVTAHIENLLDHITLARRALTYLLFYSPEKENIVEASLANACTFAGNMSMYMPAHRNQGYIAWTCARVAKSSEDPYAAVEYLPQEMKVKVTKKTWTFKSSALKKKKKTFTAMKVTGQEGSVTYKKKSGSSKLTVNASTGKVTVKKGAKKGTYQIKVQVCAGKTEEYRAASKTVTIKVRVW